MVSKIAYRLLIPVLVLLNIACHNSSLDEHVSTVYKKGDKKEWASINFNDQSWDKKIKLEGGEVFWSRTVLDVTVDAKKLQTFGLDFVNSFGEYEVYWDGVLIGKNGNPGEELAKGPSGKMWRVYKIPTNLSKKGKHLVAVRKSLYYFPDHTQFRFFVNDFQYQLEFPIRYTAFMHIFAGAFLIAALYFFFLFLGNKKEKPILVFSISCFLFFALIMVEFVRTYLPIHYSQIYIRMEIIAYLTFFIALLVPFYFSLQFKYPKQKLILLGYLGFLIYIFYREHQSYDWTSLCMAITTWFFSLFIVIWGVYKKYKGALTVLFSILICGIIFKFAYFDTSLFAGFSVILLGMFYILAVKTKEQRLAYENSLVQSTRLRLELLKKNIQPHFIMNSLTSLIDWIEESPKKGVFFIEALSKEFDLLNQIENKKRIPIAQEIELCRTHLEIMKFRKEVDYIWEQEGINTSEQVPPAILHTLLENGITHCAPLPDNRMVFKLIFKTEASYKSYTFLTFARVRNTAKEIKDGTGSKYIKARLEESYSSKWSFFSESTSEGWKNIIKIYH